MSQEEIQEAIKDIHKSIDCNGLACWQCIELSIGKGISWADKHPRKGLWDSKKVISFLKEHALVENSSNINIHINGACYHFVDDFIEDFKKAMEEQI